MASRQRYQADTKPRCGGMRLRRFQEPKGIQRHGGRLAGALTSAISGEILGHNQGGAPPSYQWVRIHINPIV